MAWAKAAFAGLSLGALVACGGCSSERLVGNHLLTAGEAWSLYEPGQQLVGELGTDVRGCVTIATGGKTALLVALNGSRLADDGLTVDVRGHGKYTLGDKVTLPGDISEWQRGRLRAARPIGWDSCVPAVEKIPLLAFIYPS